MSDAESSSTETRPQTNEAEKSVPDINSIIKNGPGWARTIAILAVLLVFVTPACVQIYEKIDNESDLKYIKDELADAVNRQTQYQLTNGREDSTVPGNTNQDPKNQVATETISAEQKHQLSHLLNPNEDPKWIVFEKSDRRNFLCYKYYHSDGCLLVARVEKGFPHTEWLRDSPVAHPDVNAKVGSGSTVQPSLEIAKPTMLSTLIGEFSFTVSAATLQGFPLEQSGVLHKAQSGCADPHPYQYRWWWGQPVNQCVTPMYRQWNDGCTHYQMYDRCNGAWGPVVWTSCNPNHHP